MRSKRKRRWLHVRKKGDLKVIKNIPLHRDSMQAWLLSHSESELQPKSNTLFSFKWIRAGTCDFIYAKAF